MRRYYFIFAAKFFILGLIASLMLNFAASTHAMTISSARDCDDNAMLRCGAVTAEELNQKYQSSGIGPVYARFGITAQEIANIDSTAVLGQVTNKNTVVVNGKVVATNAMTAGRQNMPGSTQESSGGITFYQRPPSVSFASSSLPAFVVMQNDKFSFAIIASCGNPVKATPVITQTTTTTKTTPTAPTPPAAPTKTPTPPIQQPATINITNTNTQSQSQSQAQGGMGAGTAPQAATSSAQATPAQSSAQAQTQQQASQPAASTASSTSSPAALPNTGPGNAIGISALATVFGTLGHIAYRKRKLL